MQDVNTMLYDKIFSPAFCCLLVLYSMMRMYFFCSEISVKLLDLWFLVIHM